MSSKIQKFLKIWLPCKWIILTAAKGRRIVFQKTAFSPPAEWSKVFFHSHFLCLPGLTSQIGLIKKSWHESILFYFIHSGSQSSFCTWHYVRDSSPISARFMILIYPSRFAHDQPVSPRVTFPSLSSHATTIWLNLTQVWERMEEGKMTDPDHSADRQMQALCSGVSVRVSVNFSSLSLFHNVAELLLLLLLWVWMSCKEEEKKSESTKLNR